MKKDIRETALYREAETFCATVRRPGTGQISDAAEVHVSPDGKHAVFAGTIVDKLEGTPPTRICRIDLESGGTLVLTYGGNTDRLPKYSPDGRYIAFLSDRHNAGDFQLYLLDLRSGAARSTPAVEGWVEYLHWSPDGRRILLGVAGHGAGLAAAEGAITSKQVAENVQSWMPKVESAHESYRWRRVWMYELASDRVRQVSRAGSNTWEAVWCGNDALAAVVSPGPGEGLWYTAHLALMEIETGDSREVYGPQDQLSCLATSPSGKHLSVVEAICSDRCVVAGDLRLIDTASGIVRQVDTQGVDIANTEWRSDQKLLLAGHRGFETVLAVYDVDSETFTEVWVSRDVTTGGFYATVSGMNESADCVLVSESFVHAPEIAVICQGEYRSVKSLDLGYAHHAKAIEAAEPVSWNAPDGLEIQGWLLRPKGAGPHPMVMCIHGGPVWQWRPWWLGRGGTAVLMLVKRGYAIFFPNPRGSAGRGREFTRQVVGDMGGADTHDYLSGLDHLVKQGIADPKRLGVTGVSYGGFMTSWLVTQDSRFAAAVPVAPIGNWVTAQLTSSVPHWVALFLADRYTHATGKYYQRSPIMHSHKVRTPTLNICGALDSGAPPEEAVQLHNALLENGVRSVLLTYPEEGHGIRKLPAAIDYAARVVNWFVEHMTPGAQA